MVPGPAGPVGRFSGVADIDESETSRSGGGDGDGDFSHLRSYQTPSYLYSAPPELCCGPSDFVDSSSLDPP